MIILTQVIRSIGFFFLTLRPLSKLFLTQKSDKEKEIQNFKIKVPDMSVTSISINPYSSFYSRFLTFCSIVIFF